MKTNLPYPVFVFLWGFFILAALTTCDNSGGTTEDQSADQIPTAIRNQLLDNQKGTVDSLIYYSTLAIAYIKANQLPDTLLIRYQSIKAKNLTKAGKQDEALQLFLENYLLAGITQSSRWIAKTALDLGNFYNITYAFSLASAYISQAADYYKEHPNEVGAAQLLTNLAKTHTESGQLYEALDVLKQSVEAYSFLKDSLKLAFTYSEIGNVLSQLGQQEEALTITRKGIQIVASLSNRQNLGMTLGNLATNYKNYFPDSALLYQQQAIERCLASGDSLGWIVAKYNFGNTLYALEKYPASEEIFKQVYDICMEKHISQGILISLNALGTVYIKLKAYDKAITYLQMAQDTFESDGLTTNQLINLDALSTAYTEMGAFDKAHQINTQLDSLKQLVEIEQTQAATKYLKQAIEVEKIAFNSQKLHLESLIATHVLSKRNTFLVLILSLFGSISILWLIWRNEFRSRQNAAQVLLERYSNEVKQKKSESSSTQEEVQYLQLAQQLRFLIENKKMYLDSNLKAATIVEQLGISYKELNHLLKSQFKTSLPQLINQSRVKAAQQLLSDPKNIQLSLDEIATLSGFGTRQSFYKAFQVQTGVTPGTFRSYFSAEV